MARMITAADIANEMSLPPKRVRAILRKLAYEHDGRWKWPVSEKAAIKAAIKESRRRPKAAVAAPKPKQSKGRKREQAPASVDNHAVH